MGKKALMIFCIFSFFAIFTIFASSPKLLLNVGISSMKVHFDSQTEIDLCSTQIFSQQIENITDEILGQYGNYFKVVNRSDVNAILNTWKMRQDGVVQSTQTIYHLKALDIIIVVNISGVRDTLYFTYRFLRLDGTEAFPTENFVVNGAFNLEEVLNDSYAKINSMFKNITARINMKILSVDNKMVKVYTYGKGVNIGEKLKILQAETVGGMREVGEITVKKIISTNTALCSITSTIAPIKKGDICVLSKKIVLRISTDKFYYTVGDSITITVNSNENCYIYIFDLKNEGKNGISLLFPIESYPQLNDNFISVGETLSLPYYTASKPVGTDEIVVLGSYTKLKSRDDFTSDFQYYSYIVQTLSNKNEEYESSVKIQVGS